MATDAAVGRTPVTVRPPAGSEARACRMLLPHVYARGEPAGALIAVAEAPFRILGAAVRGPTERGGRPFWSMDLHVIPPGRRQGVGTALLDAVVADARRLGVAGLVAWHDSDAGPAAGPFLAARGFTAGERLTSYEVSLADGIRYLRPFRDWILASGWLPADARVANLADAPPDAIARLHAEELGGSRAALREGLAAAAARRDRYATYDSRVLLVGGDVKGLSLVRAEGDLIRIESIVVDPAYRGGWVSVLLITADMDRAVGDGFRRVQFFAPPGARDTHKMAARVGARAVGFRDVYVCPVPPAAG